MTSFTSFVRLLLDLLHASLSVRNLSENVYLLYSLMQSAKLLQPFRHNPIFWEGPHGARELAKLCAHFQTRLEHQQQRADRNGATHSSHLGSLGIDALLSLLRAEVRLYRPHAPHSPAHAHFTYAEQVRAHEFFVPYLWALLRHQADVLPFRDEAVVLFPTDDSEGHMGFADQATDGEETETEEWTQG